MDEAAVAEKEQSVPADDGDVSKEREVKKSQRRSKEEKNRKRDEKSVEQVLKGLSSFSTPEEKLAAMTKKYTELYDDSKKHQMSAKVAEKKLVSLQREKEQLQGEQSKAVLTRSRLENLCRELQRQNKAMKEESLLRIREEEEKRKEVSAKFHSTLADITSLMQQNTESNSKLRDENLDMQSKFKSVCEQYELREQQVDKISKQMKLESQLAEAKLRKAKLEMLAEKEILERDKQAALAELAMYKSKIIDHEKTEEALRAQISVYFEKYDEFQNVLTKSNQVYAGFKGEMEKMSKKITRLEKETSSWKQKWEGSHKALLQLAAEKQMKDAEVQLQARQLTQLQKLCRSLQTERTDLLQQLKGLGIVPKVEDGNSPTESTIEENKTGTDPPKLTYEPSPSSSTNSGSLTSAETNNEESKRVAPQSKTVATEGKPVNVSAQSKKEGKKSVVSQNTPEKVPAPVTVPAPETQDAVTPTIVSTGDVANVDRHGKDAVKQVESSGPRTSENVPAVDGENAVAAEGSSNNPKEPVRTPGKVAANLPGDTDDSKVNSTTGNLATAESKNEDVSKQASGPRVSENAAIASPGEANVSTINTGHVTQAEKKKNDVAGHEVVVDSSAPGKVTGNVSDVADVSNVSVEKVLEVPPVAVTSIEVAGVKESPVKTTSNVSSPATNGVAEADEKSGPAGSSTNEKKSSPAGKSSTSPAGEQKKGKEGGRRRKK